MDRTRLAREIYQIAHLTGTFTLRSGLVSDTYFDKYRFEAEPVLLREIARQLAPLVPEGTEVLAGIEMGGIPVATALSLETGIPAAFVRKEAKAYGTCRLAEGADVTGKRVCIVEDIVTTGGQILLSAEDLRAEGANVSEVIGVIARGPEGKANLAARGLRLHALFTMDELNPVKLP